MPDRKKSRRGRRPQRAGAHATTPVAEPHARQDIAVATEPQPIVIHPPLTGGGDPAPPALPARSGAVIQVRHAPEVEPTPAQRGGGTPAPVSPEAGGSPGRRAFALDALRGLFLIAMTVGFTVRGDLFPQWMYHRQFPPPFDLAPIAGIAWRDLTYVAFLFTMAAAMPLTLARRVAGGETEIGIVAGAVKRYLLLLIFALLIGHSNTFFTGYTQMARGVAVVGFVIMALLFTRPRPEWPQALHRTLRTVGWGAAVAFLALSPPAYGEHFRFTRIDEVISGLAFAALTGSIVWYFTRDNVPARLGVLAGAVALYLGARGDGWVQQWWWSSPIAWALAPSKLSLLIVVVPGTIAGDIIRRWTTANDVGSAGAAADPGWGAGRLAALTTLAASFAPVLTIGMYTRAVLPTTQLVTALVITGLFLTARPVTSVERTLRSLFLWGGAWLVLGLFMEPFEGGMKKVPETLSYFFAVTGVSMMLLVALTALVDALGRRRWIAALIDVGHNPMLCYVLYTVLLNSVLEMIPPLRGMLRQSAGEIALRMAIETVLVVLVVRFFSRRRIFWRT